MATEACVAFLRDVAAERGRQDEKWGVGTQRDPDRFLAILMEEVGEVAKELNEERSPARMRAELVQVAAVSAKFAEWGLGAVDGVPPPPDIDFDALRNRTRGEGTTLVPKALVRALLDLLEEHRALLHVGVACAGNFPANGSLGRWADDAHLLLCGPTPKPGEQP